ncbi:hypothetical protein LguiA_026637 [Lonicera macranthoides]
MILNIGSRFLGRPRHNRIKNRDEPTTKKRSLRKGPKKNAANMECLDTIRRAVKVHLLLIRIEGE